MSRIRTTKPELWTSEQVMSCSPIARLLFIGLWNFCDDHGVHTASYKRLKGEIFPCDDFSPETDIQQWINELIQSGLLYEYEVAGKKYWIVTGWKSHQRIDKPTYRYPLPQNNGEKFGESSENSFRELDDNPATNQQLIVDCSVTESNGMESNGKETNKSQAFFSESPNNQIASTDIQEIFSYWQKVMRHPSAKLDAKRIGKISYALGLGYSIQDLKIAIDGCANTPFHMGDNDRKQVYDDITLIFRDAAHIERFMHSAATKMTLSNKIQSNADMFAGML